jgi:hypothetical protein
VHDEPKAPRGQGALPLAVRLNDLLGRVEDHRPTRPRLNRSGRAK